MLYVVDCGAHPNLDLYHVSYAENRVDGVWRSCSATFVFLWGEDGF